MANSAYTKNIRRSIKGSIGRFVAIAIIAALGTGFYSGLRMCGPDMELAADEYGDATNLSDIRVVGTLGLDDEAIEELRAIEGVENAVGETELDALGTIDDVQYAIRIHGLDVEAAMASDTSDGVNAYSDDPEYINRPILVEGSWPQADNECVLSADAVLETEIGIGDTVTLSALSDGSDLEDSFKETTFTVTGFVRMSYYLNSGSLGTTSLGTGTIDDFMLIPDTAFADDLPYTGAFLTVEGARELKAGSDEYKNLVSEVVNRIEASADEISQGRLDRIKAEAQETLDSEQDDFNEQRDEVLLELDDAEAQLTDALTQLQDAQAQLNDSDAQLDSALAQIEEAEAELESSKNQLESAQSQLDEGWEEYEAGVAELDEQMDYAYTELDAAQAQLDAWAATIDPSDLEAQAMIAVAQAEIDAQKSQLDATFEAAQQQLNDSLAQLQALQAQIDEGFEQYEEGVASLDLAKAQYQSGLSEYQSGLSEYQSGLEEYNSGLTEYEAQREDALAQLDDAQQQIDDAQSDIDSIELPDLYVLDNTKNPGIESYGSDAVRIDKIAQVFPTIFYLVAALVSLTTMTRMVDEERILIGTYKALGYSNRAIISKYLIYALLASGIGSVIGILVLTQFLPLFIMQAYSIIYIVPTTPTPIDAGLAISAAVIGIGITLLATWWAAASSLREKPASLMLPRAPKAGHRIFLEKIKAIWNRMSFSWKVTARNIFRYKKRFFMAIIGIAGCTALLLTGFGLRDSINDIINKQYENEDCICLFNLTITLDDDITDQQLSEFIETLNEDSRIENFTMVHSTNMVAEALSSDESDLRVYVEIPQNPEAFDSYMSLRNRQSSEILELDSQTVIITEKIATTFDLEVGDEFVLFEEDTVGNAIGEGFTFTVGGIMENYVNHYVYMMPELYTEVTGNDCEYLTVLAITTEDTADKMILSDDILSISGVSTVSYIDEAINYYREALSSVDSVIVVLILAAAALAFVVLYNLTNINIAERQREIATLKVLGFTPSEYTTYIFREIILLSLIGAIIGLVVGIALENFVVVTAEVDLVMFGREIHLASFLISFVLTMLFTAIISVGMKYKLNKISMVESLKSVE